MFNHIFSVIILTNWWIRKLIVSQRDSAQLDTKMRSITAHIMRKHTHTHAWNARSYPQRCVHARMWCVHKAHWLTYFLFCFRFCSRFQCENCFYMNPTWNRIAGSVTPSFQLDHFKSLNHTKCKRTHSALRFLSFLFSTAQNPRHEILSFLTIIPLIV